MAPARSAQPYQAALTDARNKVEVLEPAQRHAGECLRLQVRPEQQGVDLDIARDWRQDSPERMILGPVLHNVDGVASTVPAVTGGALPATTKATGRYNRADVCGAPSSALRAYAVIDVAHVMRQLDRLSDAPLCGYRLTTDDVRHVRGYLQN